MQIIYIIDNYKMRIEIFIILIAGLVMANIYTDGKYLKMALRYKKYYQMIGVAFFALMIYWLLKKNPTQAQNILISSNEYIKYLPLDKNATSIISPILDFTSKSSYYSNDADKPILNVVNGGSEWNTDYNLDKEMSNNKQINKRNVSESKKKFVAARQKWCCKNCNQILESTFEIDHIVRLDNGGSNHVDNLQALCPGCHRSKTQMENISKML